MSRAFVNEDSAGWAVPGRFGLPPRDDPSYDREAARALLEAAREGNTGSAEAATGYLWGEPRLHRHVRRLLAQAEAAGDDERLIRLAKRFIG